MKRIFAALAACVLLVGTVLAPLAADAQITGSSRARAGGSVDDQTIAPGAIVLRNNNGTLLQLGTLGNAMVTYTNGPAVFSFASNVTVQFAGALDTFVKWKSSPFQDSQVPTLSGFGTSPTITSGVGTGAFRINVGTGGTASTGTVTFATAATNGWVCKCDDVTTTSATVFLTKQTSSTTTTCVLGNFNTTGAAAAWAASDNLACIAFAY